MCNKTFLDKRQVPVHQEKYCPEIKYKGFQHMHSGAELNLFLLGTYTDIPEPKNDLSLIPHP